MDILKSVTNKIKISNPSFMFTGIKGSGKRHLAIDVVKNVLCKHSPACNSCEDCIRIDKNSHPDLLLIEPQEDDREIKIESIRNLSKSLSFSSAEGGKRVVLIDEAHRMNKNSANALLKTLEEPPKDTSFILLSSNFQRMLPTIISRCEIVRFAPMSREKMASILNIPEDHPFIPYTAGSISALSFFIANADVIDRLIAFLKDPVDSYETISQLSSSIMDAVSVSTKPQELENLEYIISMIMCSMIERYEHTQNQSIYTSIEELKKISRMLYTNTPYSIVIENILLEVAQCLKNSLK